MYVTTYAGIITLFNMFDFFEDDIVEVILRKRSEYSDLKQRRIYRAYSHYNGYSIITHKFKMGLFHHKHEVLCFRSVGTKHVIKRRTTALFTSNTKINESNHKTKPKHRVGSRL